MWESIDGAHRRAMKEASALLGRLREEYEESRSLQVKPPSWFRNLLPNVEKIQENQAGSRQESKEMSTGFHRNEAPSPSSVTIIENIPSIQENRPIVGFFVGSPVDFDFHDVDMIKEDKSEDAGDILVHSSKTLEPEDAKNQSQAADSLSSKEANMGIEPGYSTASIIQDMLSSNMGIEPETYTGCIIQLPKGVTQEEKSDVTISMAKSPKRAVSSLDRPSHKVKRRLTLDNGPKSSSQTGLVEVNQENPEKKPVESMFSGMRALFVSGGEREVRIGIWKDKFQKFGGVVCHVRKVLPDLTHVMAANLKLVESLPDHIKTDKLYFLSYQWVEECLKSGKLVSTGEYQLRIPVNPPDVPKLPEVPNLMEDEANDNQASKPSDDQAATSKAVKPNKNRAAQENAEEEDYSSDEDEKSVKSMADLRRRRQTFYAKQEGPNHNKHLTDLLTEMWHLYEDVLGQQWRAIAYRKAVNKLRSLPFSVRYVEQVSDMQGMGKTLEHCIKVILGTGRLPKLEELKKKPEVVGVQTFASVWGIGAIQAREYFRKGYTTIDDLKKEASLSSMVRLGLKYYDDMNIRIPREEVAEIEKYVRGIVHTFLPEAWVNVAGSYRRGAVDCGDIDVLITHPDGLSHHGLLAEILQRLRSTGFIVDGTDVSSKDVSKGANQPDIFLGICRLEGYEIFRRIDIKVYPRNVYSFALLAFTGNDVLNRKIRFLARMKGYKLSDQGLFVRESRKKGALASIESLLCETERDIFEKLGVAYPEPLERNW